MASKQKHKIVSNHFRIISSEYIIKKLTKHNYFKAKKATSSPQKSSKIYIQKSNNIFKNQVIKIYITLCRLYNNTWLFKQMLAINIIFIICFQTNSQQHSFFMCHSVTVTQKSSNIWSKLDAMTTMT